MRLRVMTYNIHAARGLDMRRRSGGNSARVSRIAEVIQSAKPDLVALQEVDVGRARSGAMDMAERLAQGSERYGICTLTRLPVVESRAIHLPQKHDREQRCALLTRHTRDGGVI